MAKTPQNTVMVTVALTTTAQSLYALLAAAFDLAPRNCTMFEVEADPVLTTQDVYCGDALVSSTNHAFVLRATSENIWSDRSGSGQNDISLTQLYLRAASGTPSVNIKVRCQ